MKTSLWLLRLTIFVVTAPLIGIIMAFVFIVNVDWWFRSTRREECVDVWRKLWSWVQGQ